MLPGKQTTSEQLANAVQFAAIELTATRSQLMDATTKANGAQGALDESIKDHRKWLQMMNSPNQRTKNIDKARRYTKMTGNHVIAQGNRIIEQLTIALNAANILARNSPAEESRQSAASLCNELEQRKAAIEELVTSATATVHSL